MRPAPFAELFKVSTLVVQKGEVSEGTNYGSVRMHGISHSDRLNAWIDLRSERDSSGMLLRDEQVSRTYKYE